MKRIVIEVEDELHKCMRLEAVCQDKTIKQYITDLIQLDLETKKEQTQ